MKPSLSRHVLALVISCSHWALAAEPRTAPRPLAELQRDLVNLRFGMFIHLSPATYLDLPDRIRPDHAPPQQGKDAIDLGAVRPLAGIRIWNRFPAKNVMLEQGLVCFSDQPFSSADGASPSGPSPIDALVLSEAPGYPTSFPVKVSARYIRLVSTAPGSVGLGEIEVIAKTK